MQALKKKLEPTPEPLPDVKVPISALYEISYFKIV